MKSRSADLLLSFDKTEQKIAWLQIFSDFFARTSNNSPVLSTNSRVKEKPRDLDFSLIKLLFSFTIPHISLNLKTSSSSKDFISLTAANFSIEGTIKESFLAFTTKLSSLAIRDSGLLSKYSDFLKHDIEKNPEEMIRIKIFSLGYEHPDYKGVNFASSLELGVIEMNYNRFSMNKILDFFGVFDENLKTPLPKNLLVSGFPDKSPKQADFPLINQHFSEISKKINPILVKTEVFLTAIELRFLEIEEVERRIFEISLKKGRIIIEKQSEELNIEGLLGNLQLFDRISREKGIEILGLGEEKNSLCEIAFKSRNSGENLLKISFNSIKIDLMMPSFLLIIEYFMKNLIILLKSKSSNVLPLSIENPQEKKKSGFELQVIDFTYKEISLILTRVYQ